MSVPCSCLNRYGIKDLEVPLKVSAVLRRQVPQLSFVTVNWQNASEALSLLDNPSERAQRMMDFVGTTEVSPSLIPSDPIFAIWWLVVIVMLMTGIWLKPQN